MPRIIMVVVDGASDRPRDGKTPLDAANTPNLDSLAHRGCLGLLYTVGKGVAPESDAGVFSLLGYDPLRTHLARGVVEAIGAGVRFEDGDLALRAGFATVENNRLVDRRAGRNLATEEAVELGEAVNKEVRLEGDVSFEFRPTVGHRAVVVFRSTKHRLSANVSNYDPAYVRKGNVSVAQPGVDIYDLPKCEPLDDSLDSSWTAAVVNEFGTKSYAVLDKHIVNVRRRKSGKKPANWFLMRDAGTARPNVPGFQKKWGLKAAMVADLPVELGIGKILGMNLEQLSPGTSVEGYRQRAASVAKLVKEYDFVYVHLKGPDEPGHDGLYELKKKRIEEIDKGFFSSLSSSKELDRFTLCVTCDHSTPWKDRAHSDDPVPLLLVGGNFKAGNGTARFCENDAEKGGLGTILFGRMVLERITGG